VRQAEIGWHGLRAPGAHLARQYAPSSVVARRMSTRSTPALAWPLVINASEAVAVIGWPIGAQSIPGVTLGGALRLAPSHVIPTRGTVLGDANYPGMARPIALDAVARTVHLHLVGPTGAGKTTLLTNVIVADLKAGFGVVVIDPAGGLVNDVLARIPVERRDDVIVLDPADSERPVGLNPLRAASGVGGEVATENLLGLLHQMHGANFGPRSTDIMRAALLTLARIEGSTLVDVAPLLGDPAFRRRIVSRITDPVGLEPFWGWYDALSDAERLAMTAAPLNKLRAFTVRASVRGIIGQPAPRWSMADVLASGKVLLVSLASGLLGEDASALLGSLVFADLWFATKARAGLPPEARRPVMAVIDEFQRFVALPTPMPSVLAEARQLQLGLVLAHQDLSQLPKPLRSAVLANARSRVVFQLPGADARLISQELGGTITAEDLQTLGAHEVVISAFADGATQAPVTAVTRPAPPTCSDGDVIREASRRRYGVDRAAVDEAIVARLAGEVPSAPIGRKRRGGSS
jgi:hypothetical protein